MRKRIFVAVLVALLATSLGCGGGSSPTAPTPPTATVAKAAGVQAVVTPTPSATPTPVLATSFEFKNSDDMEASPQSLSVWTLRGDNNSELVKQMNFCDVTSGGNSGLRALKRAEQSMTLVLPPELTGYVATFTDAAGFIGAESVASVGVSVDGQVVGGKIDVVIDPNDPQFTTAGVYVYSSPSGFITGGKMVFHSMDNILPKTIRHELGHVILGLCHHDYPGLMGRPYMDTLFLAEKDNIWVSKKVALGTRFPGDDVTSSSSSREHVFSCGE